MDAAGRAACRVVFVTDGGLATTDWANWHVLRAGVSRPTVDEQMLVPERERDDLAFVGQLYEVRLEEMAAVCGEFSLTSFPAFMGEPVVGSTAACDWLRYLNKKRFDRFHR